VVDVSIKVIGQDETAKRVREFAQFIRPQDRGKLNKKIAIAMYAVTTKNFRDERGEGKAWRPLAPSTVEWKRRNGYSKILQNTGLLRQSFGFRSDANIAMVFGKSITAKRKGQKNAAPDIAKIHQYGSGKVPARPILPSKKETIDIATKIYNMAIQRRKK